ncbi:MAG: glycosyltransferase family 2 protein [Elusimicrobiales bacterium]|nr:glycosyltransferase family 2 protein [Elusimicrobiales bacterium]
MPRVSIIILCHNDQACLRDCVESITRHTDPRSFELIVVDNGSRKEALPELRALKRKARFPFKLIRNPANRFFGPANNQGLAAAKGRQVLFLNADTIVTPGWLPELTAALDSDPRLGMVGPMTNSAVGLQVVNEACQSLSSLPRWLKGWRQGRAPGVRLVPWIIGFCVLMPRALALRLGGFDELYGPGGFEDYDLCLKTRLAGYEIGIAERVYVHHLGGRGYGGMDYDGLRKSNRELYLGKWSRLLRAKLEGSS